MAYYLDLFSPSTYEVFSSSSRDVTGFRRRNQNAANKIVPGDKLICYMTTFSRWVGVLEVTSPCYFDETPRFFERDDPFVVRFNVQQLAWLSKDTAIPIHEDKVWSKLLWTREHPKTSAKWTGRFRSSLSCFPDDDGQFLESLILEQSRNPTVYPIDETRYRHKLASRIQGSEKALTVTVPEDLDLELEVTEPKSLGRESIRIQGMLAKIGEEMGFKIWLPRSDRSSVMAQWSPKPETLLETLPLSYDDVTIRTIEQIDVLWLSRRSIIRAFEVEHTTSVYSGLLRMADLLSLQANMDIKLHIVAPSERREKVFHEIQRPVFSFLERGPLSELCTFLSYDSVIELADKEHLKYLSPDVLEQYQEEPES